MTHPIGPRHPQCRVVPSPVLLHPPSSIIIIVNTTIIMTRTHMSSPVTRMPMSQCRGSLTSSSGLRSLL